MARSAAKKRYQNTTVRMPRHVYEQAKKVAIQSQASSFNEFVIAAVEEKMRRQRESEIDAAFAGMAQDPDYQREAVAMTRAFEKSDWESLESVDAHERTKAHPGKTRSR